MLLESADSFDLIQDVKKISRLGDYVDAAVLPLITNTRKLLIKWSGPLIINRFVNNMMIKIKEICVKKPRVYLAHHTKLRFLKYIGVKDFNQTQQSNFYLI